MATKRTKKKKEVLISDDTLESTGFTNPTMEDALEAFSGGESSTAEEIEEANELVKGLKARRKKRLKDLSELKSPKDDLGKELKSAKAHAKQKIDETLLSEKDEDETEEPSTILPEAEITVEDDGTVPMPPEEIETEKVEKVPEDEVPKEPEADGSESERIKRMKRKEKEEKKEEPVEKKEEPEEEAPRKGGKGSSLRERMKSRIQKAKEEAETELREEARVQRKEKIRKEKMTRFDSEIDAAELERLNLEKSRILKKRMKKIGQRDKWKTLLKRQILFTLEPAVVVMFHVTTTADIKHRLNTSFGSTICNSKDGFPKLVHAGMPTAEEAYDFFTCVYEPEPEPEPEPEKKKEPKTSKAFEDDGVEKAETEDDEKTDKDKEEADKDKEDKSEEKEEQPDETKTDEKTPLLQADDEEEGYGFVVVRKAAYEDIDKQLEHEAKILYTPSVVTVPPEKKVNNERDVRFLEEEGFYVGRRPIMALRNQNKMENRLLREGEKSMKWFGEDGRIITLPDPLRETPSRPPVPDEPEPYLETVFKKAIMKEFDSRFIDGSVEGQGQYQIDVDINSICFQHHHLFSREHVLAMRLTKLYEQYLVRKKKNMAVFLNEKLKALKGSALHLQEHILTHKSEYSVVDRENYERRLQDYKYEIRQTRVLRDREEQIDKELIINILKTWKQIKSLRKSQGYTYTPVKLQIIKEDTDKTQEEFLWKQDIEDEVEEMKEEFREEHVRKMALYQEQLEQWQQQQEAKKEATKLQKKQKRKGSKASKSSKQSKDPDETEELLKAQETLNEPDLVKPEPPEQFEEKGLRERLMARAMETRRKPGEPKLYPELTNTATISATADRAEQQRRDELSKCKVFVKILFNNKEVSRTGSKPLSQDFKVNFGQIYSLKIVQWPESIKFEIFETYGLGSHLLAELYTAIPDPSVLSTSVHLDDVEFSSDQRIQHGHEGVGSGVFFKIDSQGEAELPLMTTGTLSSSVAWAVDEEGLPMVPPSSSITVKNLFSAMKKLDPLAAIGATGITDLEKLSKWFIESRLDPNDPKNADLVYLLKGDRSRLQPREYFRLDQLQEEFNFAADEDMERNKRYKLIQLREKEVQEFRNMKMLPAFEKELPRDVFVEYERKKREEEKIKDTRDIESHRAQVNKFVQKVREEVIQRFRFLAHQKRLSDMVVEDEVPNIVTIGITLLRVSEPRRPLRPVRKERKKMTAQAVRGEDVKILINVIRALNIPTRIQAPALEEQPEDSGGGPLSGTMTARAIAEKAQKSQDVLVRPYVEVMFQRNTVRTNCGDGPNPSFNEELELSFKAPNDQYTAENLQKVTDVLYLNLFDEVIVDILEDDQQRGSNVHHRIEKKWLGSFCVPFSTIYFNGKIDGTFRINAPPVLLGYAYNTGAGESDMENRIPIHENTYLSVFITIEPPLVQPEPFKEKFISMEDEDLLKYAENWQKELETKHPNRIYKTTVIDVSGRSLLATRYLKSLKPPEEVTSKGSNNDETAEFVARFVSMIPFVSDSVVFPGLCDIWSTCDQFLKMLSGDEEEHAVLLANYFLSMGKKAYLLIGSAIPEGPTSYVLTKEEGSDCLIWNPGTGESYLQRDNYCPLMSVGCLISEENIYANIQAYDKPSQMEFDIGNTGYWRPFYSSKFRQRGLPSIQEYSPWEPGDVEQCLFTAVNRFCSAVIIGPGNQCLGVSPLKLATQQEQLLYFTTDQDYVNQLQEKIEQLLKNKIMEWRRHITRWNRHCTQIMRRKLPDLEKFRGKAVSQEHLIELEKEFGAYKVSGFPMNMPFTEVNAIVEAVYSTGVHALESSDMEFALAVHIHPYPNSVLSVWIYVASLIRLR